MNVRSSHRVFVILLILLVTPWTQTGDPIINGRERPSIRAETGTNSEEIRIRRFIGSFYAELQSQEILLQRSICDFHDRFE